MLAQIRFQFGPQEHIMKRTKPWLAPLLTACGFLRLYAGCLLQNSAPISAPVIQHLHKIRVTWCILSCRKQTCRAPEFSYMIERCRSTICLNPPVRLSRMPKGSRSLWVDRLAELASWLPDAGWASCCVGSITQRPDPYPPLKLNQWDLFDALRGSACPSGTLSLTLNHSGIQLKLF